MKDSRIAGFYRMDIAARIDALQERGWLDAASAARLKSGAALLDRDTASRMIENVIGVFGLPFAVAPNFVINGRDCVVPMVVEEPSIVAGVSNAARLVREGGGFRVSSADPLLIGQILVVGVTDVAAALRKLEAAREDLVARANAGQPRLVARGGGARAIEILPHAMPDGQAALAVHLLVDTRDAMGANLVNSMCEAVAPAVERCVSGRAILRILSNLADRSLVTAEAVVPLDRLGGAGCPPETVRDDIVLANDFAIVDPYRAATHNKGIMNGIDAAAIATGNDWRSVEASAHAYAARDGTYRSLTQWSVDTGGNLAGRLVIPLRVGSVGGSQRANPAAALGMAIAGVQSSSELAETMAAVGLAQNLAALRALVTEGIQRGHMRLHARSVAAGAGVPPERFERVVEGMVASGDVKDWKAAALLEECRDDAIGHAAADEPQGSASGKVILLGEHAAVYGRHVLALPLARAARVWLRETVGGSHLTVSEPDRVVTVDPAEPAGNGVAGMFAFIVRELGLGGRDFDLRLALRIPTAMGLGSSAAAAVAVIRAFDTCCTLGLLDSDVDRIAFECEKLAHGNPSGIDNTLAAGGRPVLFCRDARPAVRPLDLDVLPPLVIAASGSRGITRDQVRAVRQRFERAPAHYEAIFDRIDALTLEGADALVRGDYDTLGTLMNLCHGFLNALQVSTPELEGMVHIARANGAVGAKLTGAGGGGSVVALCPGAQDDVAEALRRAGYRIVNMSNGAGSP